MIIDKEPITVLLRGAAVHYEPVQLLLDLSMGNELCEVVIVSIANLYRGRADMIDTSVFEFAEWVEDVHQLTARPEHDTAFDWELLALVITDIATRLYSVFNFAYWITYDIGGLSHLNSRLMQVNFVRNPGQYSF